VGPTPRPDVHPITSGTHLLFAQSGKIEHIPLDRFSMKKEEAKALLHIPVRTTSLLTVFYKYHWNSPPVSGYIAGNRVENQILKKKKRKKEKKFVAF